MGEPETAKGVSVNSASYALVLIFLGAGCTLGWYANRSYSSHRDVKTTKAKLPGYRRSRHQNGVVALILAFVIGIVVFSLIRPHP